MDAVHPDARSQATRAAILRAFLHLLLEQPYSRMSAQAIARAANVGRSTFYEHFSGKDDVLAASISVPFATLADAILEPDNTARITALLEHFRAQGAQARAVLVGAPRRHALASLSGLIESRLRTGASGVTRPLILPWHVVSRQLAEAMLGPIHAWLLGDTQCSATQLAVALRRVSRASLLALVC